MQQNFSNIFPPFSPYALVTLQLADGVLSIRPVHIVGITSKVQPLFLPAEGVCFPVDGDSLFYPSTIYNILRTPNLWKSDRGDPDMKE